MISYDKESYMKKKYNFVWCFIGNNFHNVAFANFKKFQNLKKNFTIVIIVQ
jgi:anaerobic selenocysteine-containing dehydrogenase